MTLVLTVELNINISNLDTDIHFLETLHNIDGCHLFLLCTYITITTHAIHVPSLPEDAIHYESEENMCHDSLINKALSQGVFIMNIV